MKINFFNNLLSIIKRFPVVIFALSLNFYILSSAIIFNDVLLGLFDMKELNTFPIFIATIFSFGMYIFTESLGFGFLKRNFLQILPVTSALFLIKNTNEYILENWIILFSAVILFILFTLVSPFIKDFFNKKYDNFKNYVFIYSLLEKGILTGVLSFLVFLLGIILIYTLFSLFPDLGGEDIIPVWVFFVSILFTPMFFLSLVCNLDFKFKEDLESKKILSFLIRYIGVIFVSVFFLILVAYTFKFFIIDSTNLAKGFSTMIISFIFIGVILYLSLFIFQKPSKLLIYFKASLPFVFILGSLLVIYFTYLRFEQHGLTIPRYLSFIFAFSVILFSIYSIFIKIKIINFIFFTASIFLIFSFGPWSIYQLPEKIQLEKLNEYLLEAKMMKDGKIIPAKDIDDKLLSEIDDLISNLCNRHGCDSIKVLEDYITNAKNEVVKNNDVYNYNTHGHMVIYYILRDLNIEKKNNHKDITYYKKNNYFELQSINIKDYDILYNITHGDKNRPIGNNTIFNIDANFKELTITENTEEHGEKILEKFSLNDFVKKMESNKSDLLTMDQMSYEINSAKYSIKIVLKYFNQTSYNNPFYTYSGYLLLKEK